MTKTKKITLASIFAALIFLFTAYIFHIPTLVGYIHFGDAFLYLVASLMPTPYAMVASVFGECLADFATGYAHYMPFTLVIKSLMVLCFIKKNNDKTCRILPAIFAGLICIFGYYLVDAFFLYNPLVAAEALLRTSVQSAGSLALYYIIARIMDKRNIKVQ